jgi:hypothetical protein
MRRYGPGDGANRTPGPRMIFLHACRRLPPMMFPHARGCFSQRRGGTPRLCASCRCRTAQFSLATCSSVLAGSNSRVGCISDIGFDSIGWSSPWRSRRAKQNNRSYRASHKTSLKSGVPFSSIPKASSPLTILCLRRINSTIRETKRATLTQTTSE